MTMFEKKDLEEYLSKEINKIIEETKEVSFKNDKHFYPIRIEIAKGKISLINQIRKDFDLGDE